MLDALGWTDKSCQWRKGGVFDGLVVIFDSSPPERRARKRQQAVGKISYGAPS